MRSNKFKQANRARGNSPTSVLSNLTINRRVRAKLLEKLTEDDNAGDGRAHKQTGIGSKEITEQVARAEPSSTAVSVRPGDSVREHRLDSTLDVKCSRAIADTLPAAGGPGGRRPRAGRAGGGRGRARAAAADEDGSPHLLMEAYCSRAAAARFLRSRASVSRLIIYSSFVPLRAHPRHDIRSDTARTSVPVESISVLSLPHNTNNILPTDRNPRPLSSSFRSFLSELPKKRYCAERVCAPPAPPAAPPLGARRRRASFVKYSLNENSTPANKQKYKLVAELFNGHGYCKVTARAAPSAGARLCRVMIDA
ncbi:hypothetical protein EVAR_19592_1 [Eumeta japonica]|uniref:Uncharacterized protein n=1 Tax=Eumeta variegata TaxID=151549 RepID=A0A4C1UF99_EUMVA|nr:hypothetical protein EVAR_19592_1 [Eumeta japonica]